MNGQRKLLIAAVLAISGAAHAQTNTGSILCASCNSEGDLANAAYDWGVNHPSTALTVLAVVSQSVPITGYFRVRLVKEPGAPPYIEVDDVTPNAQAAGMTPCPTTNAAECANWNVAMLDNRLFARSSNKYEHPITVPYTQTYIDSTISVYIENNLLRFDPQGETGLSWLHFLSAGGWPPTWFWTYYDNGMGISFQLFVGDVWTVTYGTTGFAEKFQWQGADKPPALRWKRVPNTLTYKGQRYSPPPPVPAKPITGAAEGKNNWNNGSNIQFVLNPTTCWAAAEVTVSLGGDVVTGFGFGDMQCP